MRSALRCAVEREKKVRSGFGTLLTVIRGPVDICFVKRYISPTDQYIYPMYRMHQRNFTQEMITDAVRGGVHNGGLLYLIACTVTCALEGKSLQEFVADPHFFA